MTKIMDIRDIEQWCDEAIIQKNNNMLINIIHKYLAKCKVLWVITVNR